MKDEINCFMDLANSFNKPPSLDHALYLLAFWMGLFYVYVQGAYATSWSLQQSAFVFLALLFIYCPWGLVNRSESLVPLIGFFVLLWLKVWFNGDANDVRRRGQAWRVVSICLYAFLWLFVGHKYLY